MTRCAIRNDASLPLGHEEMETARSVCLTHRIRVESGTPVCPIGELEERVERLEKIIENLPAHVRHL